jgi:hypothetical protein
MKKIPLLFFVLVALLFFDCSSGKKNIDIIMINPLDIERVDEFISLDVNSLQNKYPAFNPDAFVIYEKDEEIPFQIENEGSRKLISFVVDFVPSEKKILMIRNNCENNKVYKSRVYAEVAMKVDYHYQDGKFSGGRFQNYDSLTVPAAHTDHDALFKYEGPGWESDKVGYRYYIDWRNRIDIFGKKTNDLVLKNVGVNDLEAANDSYHGMQDWGMDIFNVGKSLGIGSYGILGKDSVITVSQRDSVICMITENGPIKAEITTEFYGWKVGINKFDLKSVLSITAGSRLTKAELEISDSPENIVSGLAKNQQAKFSGKKSGGQWSYIFLYGKQTLADDSLGIVLFYNNDELVEIKEINNSYAVLLNPEHNKITYYFGAAWEKEPDGIKSKNEFVTYIDNTLGKLNNPVSIQY